MTGPLAGARIVEIAGIGPGPFGAMMLADMGAEVLRVERPGGGLFAGPSLDLLNRGRRCVCIDLKQPRGVEALLRLLEGFDGLLEGFRPGVMERLGLGPDVSLERGTFVTLDGIGQPRPAPRFSRTDPEITRPQARSGEHTDEVFAELGFAAREIASLRDAKVIA